MKNWTGRNHVQKVTRDKEKSGCHDNGMHATGETTPRGVQSGAMTKCGERTAE